MDNFGLSFWMVDECPSSWKEEESRIKCTDASNASLSEDAILQRPVTDPATMLTFRNKYCAACNGIANGWDPWELVVFCLGEDAGHFANCRSSSCVIRKLEAVGCSGTFEPKQEWNVKTCFRDVENPAFGPCRFRYTNGSPYRLPRPLPLHSALRDACMAYNNPVVISGSDQSYKNVHCILCYVGPVKVCEDQSSATSNSKFDGFSFRSLLHVGDQDRKQMNDLMDLAIDQELCPIGYVPDDQGCRPILYNFTVLKSTVYLNFEPCGWIPTAGNGCTNIVRDGRMRNVLQTVNARIVSCSPKHSGENSSFTFLVQTLLILHARLANYEEGRNVFDQVQTWMENALRNVQLDIPGGPVGIRTASFSACSANATKDGSVTPFYGATTISTPKQNRGNIQAGTKRLLMLMAMVTAVWAF
ncbi:uncharacterized protein LOC106159647 [Lingula anatina]|uniref:Uncharacterized protein LOC106159647 n=1 Tax=Lingula anatina TaxID=7574 RepID=A0A1S3I0S3_LINAN|nr:uncharacterized protein LOC106159647 [Lingula anatina]|eukprot:XP_013391426.1 uncharacterized protein LOC106159647 [Lingula anatina]